MIILFFHDVAAESIIQVTQVTHAMQGFLFDPSPTASLWWIFQFNVRISVPILSLNFYSEVFSSKVF